MERDLVFCQFSRSQVERCDFSHFFNLYAPDKLPTGKRLGGMMNAMMFGIEGWDDDPREVHSIPEIRSFYNAFHEAWPYWLYFCNLGTEALRMMVMCCLPSIVAVKVDGRPNVAVEYDWLELFEFLSKDLVPKNVLCGRAEISERGIFDRTNAVFEYFAVPVVVANPPYSP